MSKPPIPAYPPEPPELNLSDLPTLKGKAAAAEWVIETLGLPCSVVTIEKALAKGKLSSSLYQGAIRFSTRDLWRWVVLAHRRPSETDRLAVAR
ncbi:hypothetical protein A5633_22990 [Mycolicibacterium elephantis]|uniref:hypothetical protein n=1 Tax=Mycolicibacterium elephantis TaxID=81858 RepID=UPI0007EB2686|nr:hypothetical protein [Mycolicibacterium elephantis]OBA71674.1 hypothetical protein A5633_22990 [Mycolicibacterium elephantis]